MYIEKFLELIHKEENNPKEYEKRLPWSTLFYVRAAIEAKTGKRLKLKEIHTLLQEEFGQATLDTQ